MSTDEPLKRLGGGRWETRDGRFAIEPQSGTWAVVDSTQTDELGLPLVRGPYRSLTEAKEAIGEARQSGPPQSPLEDQIRQGGRADGSATQHRRSSKDTARTPRSAAREPAIEAAPEPKRPEPPPEPKWLRDLAPADRRRARDLIDRLEKLGIDDADRVARAEIALDQPALTRLAIERGLAAAVAMADDPRDAIRAAIKALTNGRDRELDVRWRLVDERGRPIDDLHLAE